MSQLDIKEVQALLDSVANADINELTLETGDYKLTVKRGQDVQVVQAPVAAQPLQLQQVPPAALAAGSDVAAPVVEATPAPAAEKPKASNANLKEVNAPIVGTFYAASSPDAAPFVKEGDRVQVGQVLCIIEAMKLMNEIEADVAGTVVEICVRNEEPVEYGQVLFTIDPS